MGEDDEDDEIGAKGADLIGGEGKRKKGERAHRGARRRE